MSFKITIIKSPLGISRQLKAKREREKKRNRMIRIISAIVIILFAAFALWQWQVSSKNARKSEANRLIFIAAQKEKEDPTTALRIAEKARQLEKTENVIKTINRIYTGNSFYKIAARHDEPIRVVAFSPDGKTILTGSNDTTARLWDLGGNIIREFKGHGIWVHSAAFSPDGKTILTGSRDKTARLWDLGGNVIRVFKGHNHYVNSVAFSPDGKSILTGSSDGTARLWEIMTVEDFLKKGLFITWPSASSDIRAKQSFRKYKPLDQGKVFVDSLKFSLPLLVLFTWFSIRLLKGRSSSHREFIAVFFIALFAFPLAGFGYSGFLNGALDDSPPAVHQVIVLNKYYSRSKNNYTYYAVVNSWRKPESTEKLNISKSFYNYLQPGSSTITITTKPGKFGFEWIVELE
jgi:dipeptidyl aminopeptidase/acylaminoacyl peptidase